ncbi:hypothetical protein ACVBIO_08830 [Shewanella sp. 0m-8]
MQNTIQLTFNQVTATITSNEDGMFDLNNVWRTFGLTEDLRPSEWLKETPEAAEYFNIETETGVFGPQKALHAYAMWFDVDYCLQAIAEFTALVNGQYGKH